MEPNPQAMQQQIAQAQEQQQKKAEMEEGINSMLQAIMAPAAKQRLATIKLTRPERAQKLEMLIIQSMKAGKLQGKVNDEMLVDLIEQLDASESKEVKVEIKHRECIDSDEEELDIDAMF